ncbi:MAG: hemerythrin family protein [Candidatus Lambdaproteobacteria bacterium]|nr:hemerythrin family protein [Candidatus Lambdaproteobacteria bacterium]
MSAYFEWLDTFSVNVPSVDEDHKVLIALVNEVVTGIQEHRGRAIMNDALSRLIEYTGYHFDREERVMEQHRFPELEAHRAQHNSLIRQVLRFQRLYRANELEPVELGEFLIDWLTTHILHEDMKLGLHIARQSVA